MLHRIGACALALLLTMPALAQERVRRPGPPLLVVQGAEQPVRLQRATVDVDAVARSPESKGGCGSYSMASWIALARSSPAIRAASSRWVAREPVQYPPPCR